MLVKVVRKGEEGAHPLVSNLVKMPEDNRSVMRRIADKIPDRDAKSKFIENLVKDKYPEHGLLGLKHDWDMWARASQLIPLDLSNDWSIYVLNAGRGLGKGAPLDTPIPTVNGWATMGSINIGDQVFDELGNVCNVTAVTDVYIPNKAYKFYFSDGTHLEVCDEHQWVTLTNKDRRKINNSSCEFPEDWAIFSETIKSKKKLKSTKVKTTQEIVDTFTYGKHKALNHCIPVARSLKLPEAELPIEPYLFGLFLFGGGSVKCHKDDFPSYKEILNTKGIALVESKVDKQYVTFTVEDFHKALEFLQDDKCLLTYLRASESQRLEVLKGLLDIGGSVLKDGNVKFSNTDAKAFYFILELLYSLGQKPTTRQKEVFLNGKKCKDVYTLQFTPTRLDLFGLERKINKLTGTCIKKQQLRNHYRMIVNFEQVEPPMMKCIQVDSPSSMYLIGKAMIPTHNTRTASQWVIRLAEKYPECRIAMVGATTNDVIKTMVTGESGVIESSPPWFKPTWNPTYQQIRWSNGSIASYYSSEKPDRLRGPNHHFAWVDEITSWRYMEDTFDMLSYTLRIGDNPRTLISTTPKNLEFYKKLLNLPTTWTYIGSTFENRDNLSKKFLNEMIDRYSGTRLGQQELEAEILADDDSALWKRAWIDNNRVHTRVSEYGTVVPRDEILPDFIYVVLAIDPAVSVNKKSAETAISVAAYGEDGKYYVLYADSYKDTPEAWCRRVYELYDEFMCDSIVIETNQGGNLVVSNLKQSGREAPIVEVKARRGKLLRAEPIAALYERNRVRHFGILAKAESQMCNFNQHVNKGLCDIVDSTVYALQALVDKVDGCIVSSQLYAVGAHRESVMTFKVI